MPLIISEADGTLLYKSPSLDEMTAKKVAAAAFGKKSGIISIGGSSVLIKEMLVGGRKRLFYMDFDRLCKRYGDVAENSVSLLLESAFFERAKDTHMSLSSLTRIFSQTYAQPLRERGINLSVRHMAKDFATDMPVGALVLCLSLMVSFFTVKGATVTLSVSKSAGGITLFADGSHGRSYEAELSLAMLSEIAAVQNFRLELLEDGERTGLSLTLKPTDISEYGFKAADAAFIKKLCETCRDFVI